MKNIIKQKTTLPIAHHDLDVKKNIKHSILLSSTVRGIITGSSNCGKTNVMLSLLEHANGLKFKNVYLYAKSLYQPLIDGGLSRTGNMALQDLIVQELDKLKKSELIAIIVTKKVPSDVKISESVRKSIVFGENCEFFDANGGELNIDSSRAGEILTLKNDKMSSGGTRLLEQT